MRPDISGRPPPLKRIRRPGQEAAHLENTNSSNTENTTGKAAAQGWRDRSRVVDLRDEMFRRNIEHLHKLGPRVYYAMLIDLGAQRLIRTEIESLVQRYARIDPARLAAAGGDQWPPP